jgi:hypothetical protein
VAELGLGPRPQSVHTRYAGSDFLRAEAPYFKNALSIHRGTISLELLISDKPGPAMYLPPRRAVYVTELQAIKSETVVRYLDNALRAYPNRLDCRYVI